MYRILYNGNLVAGYAQMADRFFSRMIGLLFRKSLAESHALIIQPASSLHTFFMQFSIDVIFLDKENKIVKLFQDVPPFRLIFCPFNVKTAIELPAGVIAKFSLKTNTPLSIAAATK